MPPDQFPALIEQPTNSVTDFIFSQNGLIFGLCVLAVIVIFVLFFLGRQWYRTKQFDAFCHEKTAEMMLEKLCQMDPNDFEYFVAELFKRRGYETRVIGKRGRGDGCIDVIAIIDGEKNYIQCKRYSSRRVGAAAVREFYGAISDEVKDVGTGFFVTTDEFTKEAQKFAQDKPLVLIDGIELYQYILKAHPPHERAKMMYQ